MSENTLKTGREILDDYFKLLVENEAIDQDLRVILMGLWGQDKLYTKTHIVRALDMIREKRSK